MAKLTDIPKGGGGESLHFGLNSLKLTSFSFEDGQYGKQIKFVFSHPYTTPEGEEKEIQQMAWSQLQGPIMDPKFLWKIRSKLTPFVDVLACVDENAQATFDAIEQSAPEFDETSQESIEDFQVQFLTKLLSPVLGHQVNVLLHYKGEYLNIPNEKQNGWKLPFGKSPVQGIGLNAVKGSAQTVETVEAAPAPPTNNAW